jgi:hypothetical protein
LSFYVGEQKITACGVQTEVGGGYEGTQNIVLVEAKNATSTNTIIRQLYYPYRQWQHYTKKNVSILFFEKRDVAEGAEYHLWEFIFNNPEKYNSISLKRGCRYLITFN